jgi:type II secretory pathway pseudopilin PulG
MPLKTATMTKESGFTLFELCLVMAIMTPLLLTALYAMNLYQKNLETEQITRLMRNTEKALVEFRGQARRYPCPADPELSPGDEGYGVEDCSIGNIGGARDIDGDGDNESIMTGAFPIYAYNPISGQMESMASFIEGEAIKTDFQDPWGRSLVYAVTSSLTEENTGTLANAGAVGIVDERGRATGGINNNAHFAILSRGKQSACGIAGRQDEEENCDGDGVFVSAPHLTGDDPDYIDDYVSFYRIDQEEVWIPARGASNETNIQSGNERNVGFNTPTPQHKLDVNGIISTTSNIGSVKICDIAGNNCLQPNTLNNLKCTSTPTSKMYITEVKLSSSGALSAVCAPLKFNAPQSCPAGSTLQGMYTDGRPRCYSCTLKSGKLVCTTT